jgi:hypothetical protein
MDLLLGLIEVTAGFLLCIAVAGALGKLSALFFNYNDR